MGKAEHQPSGFFALRTALLPFETLTKWVEGAENPSDPEAYKKSSALLRERLQEIVARPEIREALFVASSALDE
ncbi:MAG: hypothetical protein QF645_13620, partial [Planctomycetota bacterium]|nr:hypothetical protein [Planctomycetota bacterium]